jgi:hypothetical protein
MHVVLVKGHIFVAVIFGDPVLPLFSPHMYVIVVFGGIV